MKNPRVPAGVTPSVGHGSISRRRLLVLGGVVAAGGLSGCLDRVASAVTNTGASPAAAFAGSGDDSRVTLLEPRVTRLTPTLSAEASGLSGEVELEGWATAASVMATDYNSSRSNTSSTVSDPDSDGDGVDDGTDEARASYNNTRSNRSTVRPPDIVDDYLDEDSDTYGTVSRLDDRLKEATAAAWRSISKRSARTGRNPELDEEVSETLGDMDAALAELRAELERCSDDVCVAALANVADREADLSRAKEHVENEAWAAFGLGGGTDHDILLGDYLLPPATFDPTDSYSAGEQATLYRYLEGEAVVAERCTVCLPDAEVPGGNGSLRDGVTPKRIVDYLTGTGEGTDHGWGGNINAAAAAGGDCDDDERDISPGKVCGSTSHFVAEVTGPVATGGNLEVVRTEDGSVFLYSSDRASTEATEMQIEIQMTLTADPIVAGPDGDGSDTSCSADDDPCGPGVWARTTKSGSSTGVSVYQVMVQPPQCPHPFPALLYVQRCGSDDQLIYTGGWVIDDAALYENSATVLSMAGPTQVVGIECCFDYSTDADGDGFGDVVARAGLSARARRGARIESGTVSALVASGRLPEDGGGKIHCRESGEYSRTNPSSCGEADGARGDVLVTHCPLDAPVLHLVNAGSASNEVKFKAGAELSKAVN